MTFGYCLNDRRILILSGDYTENMRQRINNTMSELEGFRMKKVTKSIVIFMMILFILSIVVFIAMGRGSNKPATLFLIIGHILLGISDLIICVGVCKNDKYNKVIRASVVFLGIAIMSIVFLMCFGLLHILKGLSVSFSVGIALVILIGIISIVIGIISMITGIIMNVSGAKKQNNKI